MPPGIWRGVLYLNDTARTVANYGRREKVDRIVTETYQEGQLPFNFEIQYIDKDKMQFVIHNASERIVIPHVEFGKDRTTGRDTVRFEIPPFDSYIIGNFEEDQIEGYWMVPNKTDYSIRFKAVYSKDFRFEKAPAQSLHNLEGIWETIFDPESEEPEKAIGEFKQEGQQLTGTFRTETGDYRFLEGVVSGDKAYLSCFDGSHAFLFTMDIVGDQLNGRFYSGKHYSAPFIAKRNPTASLASPDSLTKLNTNTIQFAFENATGKVVSLNDPAFQGKSKIIQVMGSWCPNCKDESEFLRDFVLQSKDTNIIVIALAFERHKEQQKVHEALHKYKSSLRLPYEVLWAGHSNKDSASLRLPFLKKVIAYPTMIFVNKHNQVVKMHTGFDGPASSKHGDFKIEFDKTIQQLSNVQ